VHENASHVETPADPDGWTTPMSVFLSWSGGDSRAISTAFKELLLAIDPTRVDPFHSADMVSADPWREQIKKAVARSRVPYCAWCQQSVSSTWLMYEAGAFFDGGDTYLLGCGVDDKSLRHTRTGGVFEDDAHSTSAGT
jgi:hypothetical protein